MIHLDTNIGLACTRSQCEAGKADKIAMHWRSVHGERQSYCFSDLDRESDRTAAAFAAAGLEAGDVLFIFLPKLPELFFSFLGALKHRLTVATLFANIGEEAMQDRLADARGAAIIIHQAYLRKLRKIRPQLPALRTVIVIGGKGEQPGEVTYEQFLAAGQMPYTTVPTAPETPSVLHYTSGSTGKPKGVLHCHHSILHQQDTTRDVLGLDRQAIYWCTAEQGWVTGTSYGIIGPWSNGITQVHYEGGYDAQAWLQVLQEEQVTVWYTAPTALRMLMREPEELFHATPLPSLRAIYSVGEPLNPEVVTWCRSVLGKEVYDTWFQTETGGIMIANRPGMTVKPGSMGRPVNGIEAAILDDNGAPLPANRQGQLCIRSGWPSLFITYLHNATAYNGKFSKGYYLTGDMAWQDNDGYFWFVGRSDDVINTAGHLVSPFEIESALLELPEVLSIRLHVAKRVASIATPQEVCFVERVPKNRSGKIMRRVLRARYLGLPEGDLSTMEDA